MSSCCWALRLPGFLLSDCAFSGMGICKGIFEFWPQKMGGTDHERVTRSKKRRFLWFFGKVLTDRRLRRHWFVIGWFTKYEFARVKVSLRERLGFVVWKVMFEAMKHGLWCGQSLAFAVWKLSDGKMKNDEWRVKNRLLQFLTSLSSLFPDKFLSVFFTIHGDNTSQIGAVSKCSVRMFPFACASAVSLILHCFHLECDCKFYHVLLV